MRLTALRLLVISGGLTLVLNAQPAATVAAPPHTPILGGCFVLPYNNIWNTPIETMPVDPNSTNYINYIGASTTLHPDFGSGDWPPGSGAPIGIPYVIVPASQPSVTVSFYWPNESDPSPYPIPANAPIEGGPDGDGDRHVLVLQQGTCRLYETYDSWPNGDGSWDAGSGALFNLNSNALRPANWTSADAAGLPILPGLVRYDEVAAGEITHALRFTVPCTRAQYIWPARHYAVPNGCTPNSNTPPMGLRLRLKANYNIAGFAPQVQVILRALKRYGMMVADNGSAWYISGAPDARWDNDILHELGDVPGSAFEVVDVSSLMVSADSGQAVSPFILNIKFYLPWTRR